MRVSHGGARSLSGLRVFSDWRPGQRTPLWDALWHRILADIALEGRVRQPGEALPQHPEGRS
jgi:hypothetical protein